MNLLEIRKKVVQSSGRYDLIIDSVDYADNGMNYYINAAIQLLDRLVNIPDSEAHLYYLLEANDYSLTVPAECRVLDNIWIYSTEERWKLNKLSIEDFKEKYATPIADITVDAPIDYTFMDMRSLAPDDQTTLGAFISKPAVLGSGHGYRGIIFGPPLDTNYIFELVGLFKQVKLSNDEDTNYWSYQEEDLLIRTSLYKLEAHSRGTENAKNWLSAIKDDVKLIDFDVAEEESKDVNQMRG